MAFNPNEHMMNLKGKDYLQVAWRLVWFREKHPNFGINTIPLSVTENHAIFKAVITDQNGIQLSSAHGSESQRDFHDFIEKAETKAIGRALAILGFGTQFAADELEEGQRIVDSPIARGKKTVKEAPVEEAPVEEEKLDLPPAGSFNPRIAISAWCKNNGITAENFKNLKKALSDAGIVTPMNYDDMGPEEVDQLCKAIETNYPELLRKPA